MTTSEARVLWCGTAARMGFRRCDGCSRICDGDGRLLYCARGERRRLWLCFECFARRAA